MSRLTWFVAGAATGVYGIVKARRAARNLTPDGIAGRAAALGAGLRVFTSEVSAGMAERESELRDQLALDPGAGLNAVPAMIERTANPRHRRDQSRWEPATDGHR